MFAYNTLIAIVLYMVTCVAGVDIFTDTITQIIINLVLAKLLFTMVLLGQSSTMQNHISTQACMLMLVVGSLLLADHH